VLAGILVKVGYDIIDFAYLKHAHKGPRWDLILMATVLGLTVFVDLISAVAVGVVMAALAFVKRLADLQLEDVVAQGNSTTSDEENELLASARNKVTLFDFTGPLSFGAAADLGHTVRERVREHTNAIVLDFTRLSFIDVSAARAVETIACDAKEANKTVYVAGMNEEVAGVLSGLGSDHCLPDNTTYSLRLDAIRAAVAEVTGAPGGSSDNSAAQPA